MKNLITGIIIGAVIVTAVFVPILLREQRAKFDFGFDCGKTAGLIEAVKALDKEFGRCGGKAKYKRLFSVSDADVVSVETNGVKTVRIIL